MITTINCGNCGQENKVDTEKLTIAACESCMEKLIDEYIPESITNSEITTTLKDMPQSIGADEVDISKWTGKIGDPEEQAKYVKKGFLSKVKKYASKVPFTREAVAMYYCAIDPATPLSAKATAIGALAYWILPIDLFPDFVPVIGFTDDASAIFIAYKAIYSHIKEEHHKKAEQFFAH